MRVFIASLAVVFAAAIVQPVAQQPRSGAARLPPVVMSCPHHPDVVEDHPGACPICRMPLAPVRVDAAWMCPIHQAVVEPARGTCRLCARPLVPVAASLTFVCRGEPGGEHLDPGVCADGTPRVQRRTLRPHGNHNAQHGGQFFMAPDNWHHLEGAYPRERVFRLYLYDDYARTLPPRRLKEIRARVVTRETYDPATRRTTELAAVPLTVAGGGAFLEARVDVRSLPATMTAKVRFAADAPEYRFDFTFRTLTGEPRPVPRAVPPPLETAVEEAPEPTGFELPAPKTMAETLAQMKTREGQVAALVRRGEFSVVWIPAFAAKELAVALGPHVAHLASADRSIAEPALREIVRGAWTLDAVADVGDRPRIEEASRAFSAAVAQAIASFGGAR